MKYVSIIRPIIIWCVTLLIPVTIFLDPIRDLVRVLRNPTRVEGTVVGLHPEDHRTVVISYQAGDRTFQSSTSLPETVGLPRFENIHIGDEAPIVYNPQYPAKGITGDPKKLLMNTAEDFALVAVGVLFFSIILDLYCKRWFLKFQSRQ